MSNKRKLYQCELVVSYLLTRKIIRVPFSYLGDCFRTIYLYALEDVANNIIMQVHCCKKNLHPDDFIKAKIYEANLLIDRVKDTLSDIKNKSHKRDDVNSRYSNKIVETNTAIQQASYEPICEALEEFSRPKTRRTPTCPGKDVEEKFKTTICNKLDVKLVETDSFDVLHSKLNTILEQAESSGSETKENDGPMKTEVKPCLQTVGVQTSLSTIAVGTQVADTVTSCISSQTVRQYKKLCQENNYIVEIPPVAPNLQKINNLNVQLLPPINIKRALTIQPVLKFSIDVDGETNYFPTTKAKNCGFYEFTYDQRNDTLLNDENPRKQSSELSVILQSKAHTLSAPKVKRSTLSDGELTARRKELFKESNISPGAEVRESTSKEIVLQSFHIYDNPNKHDPGVASIQFDVNSIDTFVYKTYINPEGHPLPISASTYRPPDTLPKTSLNKSRKSVVVKSLESPAEKKKNDPLTGNRSTLKTSQRRYSSFASKLGENFVARYNIDASLKQKKPTSATIPSVISEVTNRYIAKKKKSAALVTDKLFPIEEPSPSETITPDVSNSKSSPSNKLLSLGSLNEYHSIPNAAETPETSSTPTFSRDFSLLSFIGSVQTAPKSSDGTPEEKSVTNTADLEVPALDENMYQKEPDDHISITSQSKVAKEEKMLLAETKDDPSSIPSQKEAYVSKKLNDHVTTPSQKRVSISISKDDHVNVQFEEEMYFPMTSDDHPNIFFPKKKSVPVSYFVRPSVPTEKTSVSEGNDDSLTLPYQRMTSVSKAARESILPRKSIAPTISKLYRQKTEAVSVSKSDHQSVPSQKTIPVSISKTDHHDVPQETLPLSTSSQEPRTTPVVTISADTGVSFGKKLYALKDEHSLLASDSKKPTMNAHDLGLYCTKSTQIDMPPRSHEKLHRKTPVATESESSHFINTCTSSYEKISITLSYSTEESVSAEEQRVELQQPKHSISDERVLKVVNPTYDDESSTEPDADLHSKVNGPTTFQILKQKFASKGYVEEMNSLKFLSEQPTNSSESKKSAISNFIEGLTDSSYHQLNKILPYIQKAVGEKKSISKNEGIKNTNNDKSGYESSNEENEDNSKHYKSKRHTKDYTVLSLQVHGDYVPEQNSHLKVGRNGRYKDEENLFCDKYHKLKHKTLKHIPRHNYINKYPLNSLSCNKVTVESSISEGEIKSRSCASIGEVCKATRTDKIRHKLYVPETKVIRERRSYFNHWVTYYINKNKNMTFVNDSSSTST